MSDNFFSQYLSYVGETEAPLFYHRWSCLSMIGAFLGREFWFPFGHSNIYPNMYVMLIGEPGTRKSTAIRLAKKIITSANYNYISADKTSKEKFILDLAEQHTHQSDSLDNILDTNLWGNNEDDIPYSQMYIACDEFNDFIGLGNLEFISLLGNFWDFAGAFENKVKNSKSVKIKDPTISILGGNTATSFANAFPPDVMGQGFFSRLLLIHGESTGIKIPFPSSPPPQIVANTIEALIRIKSNCVGEASISKEAKALLSKIYVEFKPLADPRFISYSNRRFTHLIKLCILTAAMRYSKEISARDVIEANTILTHTESIMPKALGFFGRARNAQVTHKIMETLRNHGGGMGINDLWGYLHSDMDKVNDLVEVMKNLLYSQSVLSHEGKFYYKNQTTELKDSDVLSFDILFPQEKELAA